MTSTRTHILSYLERHYSASVRELANALHMTPANIRHHLTSLQKEGVVTKIGGINPIPRGRPVSKFALTKKSQAHNFALLSDALLNFIYSTNSFEPTHIPVEIARLITEGKGTQSSSLTQRLIHTTKLLNTLNYDASWEAEKDAPVIKFSHCPYQQILSQHPELCEIDFYILWNLINKPIKVLFTQKPSSPTHNLCKFQVFQS
ncbi:MAG: helix-turn-helix transcriptional regulator [Anaerolineales bacterium]